MNANSASERPGIIVAHPRSVICLPCFNEEHWLARTLDSVLAQSMQDFAVLISDNASTDGTVAIAEAFAARDPRFHVYCHDTNIGASANFNFARAATDSPYLLWLGAHDLLHPDFLAHHVATLEADPSLSLSQSAHEWIDEDGRSVERVEDLPLARGGADNVRRFLASIGANRHNIGANSVIRRTMLDGIAFTVVMGTDRILLSHLAFRGPFATSAKVLYFRRTFASDRGGWDGYMERLAGRPLGPASDSWTVMARAYDKHFHSLIGDGRRQRAARAALQLVLRYYLPVAPRSLATRGLWLVRRTIKLVTAPLRAVRARSATR